MKQRWQSRTGACSSLSVSPLAVLSQKLCLSFAGLLSVSSRGLQFFALVVSSNLSKMVALKTALQDARNEVDEYKNIQEQPRGSLSHQIRNEVQII